MYASVGEPREFSAQKKAVLPFDKEFQLFYLNEVTYLGKNKDMYLYQCI